MSKAQLKAKIERLITGGPDESRITDIVIIATDETGADYPWGSLRHGEFTPEQRKQYEQGSLPEKELQILYHVPKNEKKDTIG